MFHHPLMKSDHPSRPYPAPTSFQKPSLGPPAARDLPSLWNFAAILWILSLRVLLWSVSSCSLPLPSNQTASSLRSLAMGRGLPEYTLTTDWGRALITAVRACKQAVLDNQGLASKSSFVSQAVWNSECALLFFFQNNKVLKWCNNALVETGSQASPQNPILPVTYLQYYSTAMLQLTVLIHWELNNFLWASLGTWPHYPLKGNALVGSPVKAPQPSSHPSNTTVAGRIQKRGKPMDLFSFCFLLLIRSAWLPCNEKRGRDLGSPSWPEMPLSKPILCWMLASGVGVRAISSGTLGGSTYISSLWRAALPSMPKPSPQTCSLPKALFQLGDTADTHVLWCHSHEDSHLFPLLSLAQGQVVQHSPAYPTAQPPSTGSVLGPSGLQSYPSVHTWWLDRLNVYFLKAVKLKV